jgi:uncharacterized RDD family membrane protein YckC
MVWRRIAAFLIDALVLAIIAVPFMEFTRETRVQDGNELQTFKVGLDGIKSLIWAATAFVYFVGMETALGKTIGKAILGIRVVRQDGRPCSFGCVLLRNVMRVVDAFPYVIPYVVGFIVLATNDGQRRVGDVVAGTTVVRAAESVAGPQQRSGAEPS